MIKRTNWQRNALISLKGVLFIACACLFAGCGILSAKAGGTNEVTVPAGSNAKTIQMYLDWNTSGYYDELIINIPDGKYALDRTLYVYSNTTIKAGEKAVFEKQKINGAMLEGKIVNDKGGYDTVTNITIDGGVWDSTPVIGSKVEGTETFRFIHASNIQIMNAEFSNVPVGSHLIVFAGVADSKIENCVFHGYGNGSVKNPEPKEAIQLDIPHNSEIVPTLQEASVKWNDLPCKNITIRGCEFYDYSRAIGSHIAVQGVYHEGIVIDNNIIRDMDEVAIKLYNYKDTTISNNKISGGAEAILVYTALEGDSGEACLKPLKGKPAEEPENHNIVITGNTIEKATEIDGVYGDAIRISASEAFPIVGVKISKNIIKNVSRYGIFVTQVAKAEITSNEITSCGNHAILLEKKSTDAVVKKNTISKPGKSGIALYSASNKATVSGNTITEPKEAGVYLYDNVKSCSIGVDSKNYNTIKKAKENGIHITGKCDSNTIAYNKITNAEGDGIFVYESASVTMKNNKISAAKNGINVNSNSKKAKITSNTIESAGEFGIRVYTGSTTASVTKNTIKKYATNAKAKEAYAIGLYQAGGTGKKDVATISGNKITGTGKSKERHAIRLSECDYVTIDSNTVTKADGYGVTLLKSKNVTISKNTIEESVRAGIYTTTSCKAITAKENIISKPGEEAIWVRQAPESVVTKNTITANNKYAGIRVSESDKTKVTSNTVTGGLKGKQVQIYSSENCTNSENSLK